MTKQRLPDICNFCKKEIDSEMQYASEWFQGKTTFSDPRIRLKQKLDCCQKCFLDICKNSDEKMIWVKEMKNPQWVAGSKKADEKYFILVNSEKESE